MASLKLPAPLVITMASVRSVLPSAFLAGGALRDLDNGRPVKDYDVFFTEHDYSLYALDAVLEGLNYHYRSRCSGAYMDGAAGEVDGTSIYYSTDCQPDLNLIQLDKSFNPARIIDRVDFGICQIGYSEIGVVDTTAYEFDKRNQCFTLTRAESVDGVERSLKRFERLQKKYPGWVLNVPDEYRALYRQAVFARCNLEDTF